VDTLAIILQLIIALGIFNVWLLRPSRATAWRGGGARTMREEFAAYGLPEWSMWAVGALKLGFAVLLIVGIWAPGAADLAALGIAVLMAGAVFMHLNIRDPLKKALPSFTLLVLSLVVIAL
jgi:uncharacterized membrane protein YphA (DoxX/SURF4 family)